MRVILRTAEPLADSAEYPEKRFEIGIAIQFAKIFVRRGGVELVQVAGQLGPELETPRVAFGRGAQEGQRLVVPTNRSVEPREIEIGAG